MPCHREPLTAWAVIQAALERSISSGCLNLETPHFLKHCGPPTPTPSSSEISSVQSGALTENLYSQGSSPPAGTTPPAPWAWSEDSRSSTSCPEGPSPVPRSCPRHWSSPSCGLSMTHRLWIPPASWVLVSLPVPSRHNLVSLLEMLSGDPGHHSLWTLGLASNHYGVSLQNLCRSWLCPAVEMSPGCSWPHVPGLPHP